MTKNRNWTQYNESLVNRGSITFWFSDDVLKLWNHRSQGYRRGRPFVYSDTTIETLLIMRAVFHLTYRSAEGFGRNIFSLLKVQKARIPDYTSLCKRSKTLNVSLKLHGKRGDGAYDKRSVYHTTSRLGIHPVIPPRKNARYDQNGDWGSNGIYRNGAILISRLFGSDTWKEQVNYHQRSLVETAMFRIKKLFGERLKNRTMKNQWVETMVKINALNILSVFTSAYFS